MFRPSRQLFLISAVAVSLTSCTAPLSNSSGSGGGSGATGGDGGSVSSTGGSGSTTQETGTGTGGGTCLDEHLFAGPVCDECAQTHCCAESEACLADPNCFNAEGSGLDQSTAAGAALDKCLLTSCDAECYTFGVCRTNLFFDLFIDLCVEPACCTELNACGGVGDQVCIDCIDAYFQAQGAEKPGAACAEFIGCGKAEFCFG